jgi:hypothetical protein
MKKGTLRLKDGTSADFEYETTAEWISIIKQFGNTELPKVETPRIESPIVVNDPVQETVKVIVKEPKKKEKESGRVPWSEKDILIAAKVISKNLNTNKNSSMEFRKILKKEGDYPKRKIESCYTLNGKIRTYLREGKILDKSEHIIPVLKANGFNPVVKTENILESIYTGENSPQRLATLQSFISPEEA